MFYKPLQLERITPVSGPGEVAGTEVHIYGENFANISTLTCRFSDTNVPGEYVSSKEIICYTPPCLKSYTGGAIPPIDKLWEISKFPEIGLLKSMKILSKIKLAKI